MAGGGSYEVGGRGGRSPRNGWLSNVVYPASRLGILFNYAFGKPLPKPALPPPIGISENGFMTPRSRGMSTLYSMACTPYSRVNPTTTMKVCWVKNITRHSFTLLLVFQSSLFCLSLRVLHRHLMFMVDHHHLSLDGSKIEFLGLNKGYTCLSFEVNLFFITLWILLLLFAATKAQEFSPGQ